MVRFWDSGPMAFEWTLPQGKDLLGQTRYGNVRGPQEKEESLPGGCASVRASPVPALPANDFLAAAQRLDVTSPAPPDFGFWIFRSLDGAPPETGWGRYYAIYYPPGTDPAAIPDGAVVFPNHVAMNANHGRWDFMTIPLVDHDRLGHVGG